jgi:hypothetical protein
MATSNPCVEVIEACGEWFVRVVDGDEELIEHLNWSRSPWLVPRASGDVSGLLILIGCSLSSGNERLPAAIWRASTDAMRATLFRAQGV